MTLITNGHSAIEKIATTLEGLEKQALTGLIAGPMLGAIGKKTVGKTVGKGLEWGGAEMGKGMAKSMPQMGGVGGAAAAAKKKGGFGDFIRGYARSYFEEPSAYRRPGIFG
jgi:hypothetical protein